MLARTVMQVLPPLKFPMACNRCSSTGVVPPEGNVLWQAPFSIFSCQAPLQSEHFQCRATLNGRASNSLMYQDIRKMATKVAEARFF